MELDTVLPITTPLEPSQTYRVNRQRPRNHQLRAARDRPPRHVHRGVPLGADFEPGVEYTVVVNADTSVVFVAGSP